MRKCWLSLCLTVGLVCCAEANANEWKPATALAFETLDPPVLDGDCADFTEARAVVLQIGPEKKQALVKMLWDQAGWHICIQVQDDYLEAPSAAGGLLSEDDGFWFELDPHYNGKNPDSDNVSLTVSVADLDAGKKGSEIITRGSDFSYQLARQGSLNDDNDIDSGYTVEMFLPWDLLGQGVAWPGAVWGLKFALRDRTGDSLQSVYWLSSDPDEFGDLLLLDPDWPYLRINSGDATLPVLGWEDESPYRTGGDEYIFAGPVDLNWQVQAAPADLYLSCAHHDHTYLFPVLNGSYLVRLHFYDQYPSAADSRRMDYSIEGVKVLDDFNIVTAAGGAGRAWVEEFQVYVEDGDGMEISAAEDQGVDAFETGIEILAIDGLGCDAGLAYCGGPCVDLTQNPLHCGECFLACPDGDLCSEGQCLSSCSPDLSDCGGKCVDLWRSPMHCGECFLNCAKGDLCSNGQCSPQCGEGTIRDGDQCVALGIVKGCATAGNLGQAMAWRRLLVPLCLLLLLGFSVRLGRRHC